MSDLLNQASLVMVPSGYKEDTVYSVVPSDGSGDLSFTRASNGTRVNSAGLVEVAPWNLLDNSQATWQPVGVTVTTGITDPKGNTAGYTISSIGSGNITEYGYQPPSAFPIAAGGVITYSIYMKGSGTIATYIERAFSGTYFIDTKVHTLTSEYQLFTHSYTATSDFGGVTIYVGNATGTTANSVTIAFPQVNYGSTAKPYFPTTDRFNVPRLTYQNGGGGCPSLLLEKQSTNLTLDSQDFTTAGWIKLGTGLTVSGDTTISPDGTQNADTLNVSNNNNVLYRSYSGTFTGNTFTFSIYAKGTGTFDMNIRLNSTTTTTQTKTLSSAWQRFDVTVTNAVPVVSIEIYLSLNTSSTYNIWGAQLENSNYPTSYISTTSSSATRVADACFKTGISSLIGQTEGVAFVDFVVNGFEDYGTPLSLNDGSTSNYIWFTTFANGNLRVEAYSGGAVQAQIVMTGGVVGQRYKMAFAYKTNDFVLYINGTQIGVDAFGSVPPNLSRVDSDLVGAWAQQSQKINQCALFKTRLSNSDLIALTTI